MDLELDLSAVTLETPRLVLRPWRQGDLADFYAYASVPAWASVPAGRITQVRRQRSVFCRCLLKKRMSLLSGIRRLAK